MVYSLVKVEWCNSVSKRWQSHYLIIDNYLYKDCDVVKAWRHCRLNGPVENVSVEEIQTFEAEPWNKGERALGDPAIERLTGIDAREVSDWYQIEDIFIEKGISLNQYHW